MSKEIETNETNDIPDNSVWIDDIDSDLPDEIAEGKKNGKLPQKLLKTVILLTVRDWTAKKEFKFKAALGDTLGEIFVKASQVLGKELLPPGPGAPLDLLRCKMRKNEWSDPITDFDEPLWLALLRGCKRRFAIEYLLVVKVNTQWRVAVSDQMTPRDLLSLFGMDAQEFSLYSMDGSEPLPVDVPLELKRGDRFEAQKDGRYGSGAGTERMRKPARGSQTIEEDIEAAQEAGIKARLLNVNGQKYVEVQEIDIPSPPWGKTTAGILVAVPATYPSGGLDALYVELPLTHSSGTIPYQQQAIQIDGRDWMLISWHYHQNHPWNPLSDDLETHIQHCRGFFLTRGVKQ